MAKRLSERESAALQGPRRPVVSWAPYADGSVWVLTAGEDYPVEASFDSLRYSAYSYGRHRGLGVSVRKLGPGALAVCFTDGVVGRFEDSGVPGVLGEG